MGKIYLSTAAGYLLIILAALPRTKGDTPPALGPGGPPDCITYLGNTSDCMSFVESGSRLRNPDPACCPELAGLINSQPICLCKLVSNATQFDMSIDVDKAIKLPSLCNIHTSDTMCMAMGIENAAGTTILLPSKQHFLIGAAFLFFTSIL